MLDKRRTRDGVLCGLGVYILWGVFPLYFKLIKTVPAVEVLAHRVIWSFLLLAIILAAIGRWKDAVAALANPVTRRTLMASTILIACNWLLFIHAISSDQILQASLGYFITPLMNVALGVLFLRERLKTLQIVSLVLAGAGVFYLTLQEADFPWIAALLAVTFAFYGLLRKTVAADGLIGLSVETAFLTPLAAIYLSRSALTGGGSFNESITLGALLVASGPVTAVPLLLFATAARRMRLSTLGFLQFLAPTIQFVLAVAVFHEPLSRPKLISFVCIWTAIVLFTIDARRKIVPPPAG